jgi:hypothetical protein
LNGKTVILRPTFERLVAAEAEIGSLIHLIDRISSNKILLKEVSSILWHCADDNIGDRIEFEQNMFNHGIQFFIPSVLSILYSMFTQE